MSPNRQHPWPWLIALDRQVIVSHWECVPPIEIQRTHYGDVIMGAITSQITSLTIVYSTVYSDADPRKHQSSASLAFVWGIHRGPVNSPHKWPVTRKMFPFDDVIMNWFICALSIVLEWILQTTAWPWDLSRRRSRVLGHGAINHPPRVNFSDSDSFI